MKTLSQKHRTTACVAGRFVTGHQENEERTGLDNSVVLTGNKLLLHEQRSVDLTSTALTDAQRDGLPLPWFLSIAVTKIPMLKLLGAKSLHFHYHPSLL